LQRFHELVQEKKVLLLEDPYAEEAEPEWLGAEWLPREVELPPRLVHDVMREFAGRSGARLAAVLGRAGIRATDLTHVLFAGGVCRSDIVQNELLGHLPEVTVIRTPDDPQLQTAIGCARLSDPRKRVSVELAADLAVRQCDDSYCVLLPRGQAVELNGYRRADFLVTDVTAREAVFDLGVYHHDGGQTHALSGGKFHSLLQLYVPTGEPLLESGATIPDLVRVHVGVDSELSVGIHLEARRSKQTIQEFVSGVPLAIRIEGAGT
jgi:hypothetical protein